MYILLPAVIYAYCKSLPAANFTLLTSATKSLIVSMIFSTVLLYGYLFCAALFWDELRESWDTNGNVTCYFNPVGNLLSLYPTMAGVEFMMLRTFFDLFPYQFLALNHEELSLYLELSIPIISLVLQILQYLIHGTLCTRKIAVLAIHYKIGMNIDFEEIFFARKGIDFLPGLLIFITSLIRGSNFIYKKLKTSKLFKWKRNQVRNTPKADGVLNDLTISDLTKEANEFDHHNPVDKTAEVPPASNGPSRTFDTPVTVNNSRTASFLIDVRTSIINGFQKTPAQSDDSSSVYKAVGPLAWLVLIIAVFSFTVWLTDNNSSIRSIYLLSVFIDCFLLVVPIYCFLNSKGITSFAKLRFIQLKARFYIF